MPCVTRGPRCATLLAALLLPVPLAAQHTVTGVVTVLDRGGRPADDVAQAVIWLSGPDVGSGRPVRTEMATQSKQFAPHLIVVPVGSTVAFPNHDGFKHNVFSRSPEATFDLGLYGRGEGRTATFDQPGVIRVYCNVHAQMRGIVRVVASDLVAQPGSDGRFRLADVPPGEYTLHAWHERAATEITQAIRVGPGADPSLVLTLDAQGYQVVQHRNKDGKPYKSDRSSRY